jgi:hypothetical protein
LLQSPVAEAAVVADVLVVVLVPALDPPPLLELEQAAMLTISALAATAAPSARAPVRATCVSVSTEV